MHKVTVDDFCNSKEMWFLEQMNRRNRLRLIQRAATLMGVQVASIHDIYANPHDRVNTVPVESCGMQTEFFDKARTFSHSASAIPGSRDHEPIEIVRHFKGCIDLSTHCGPVPVFVSEQAGVVVLTADDIRRNTSGIDNDKSLCTEPGVQGSHCLFPSVNIKEDCISHNRKILREMEAYPHICMGDIVQHSVYTQTVLSDNTSRLLESRDYCGVNLYYGVHYGSPLPVVLYPRTNIQFRMLKNTPQSDVVSVAPEVDNIPPPDPAISKDRQRLRPRTVTDAMCNSLTISARPCIFRFDNHDLEKDEQRICLAWDDCAVKTIMGMTLPRNCHMNTTCLTPILVYTSP